MISFGDSATNTGSFHEAADMAALWVLPMVFICQNHQYAEIAPTPDTMKLMSPIMRPLRHPRCSRRRQRPAGHRGGAGRGVRQGAPTVTDPPSSSA